MTRTRAGKALIASGFAYMQFLSAIVIGILLVPLMLDRLGTRTYGLWLATGELLAYVSLLDLGVFGVLPWMIAEAEGRRDPQTLSRLMANGLLVGLGVAAVYVLGGVAGWVWLADFVGLPPADRELLFGPLGLLILSTAVTYPLNLFAAALTGLQDFTFNGAMALVQVMLRAGLMAGLLVAGAGLYALAIATAVPAVLIAVASTIRVRMIAPELFTSWQRPSWRGVLSLFREGVGGWLGGFGWKLSAGSQAVVIAFVASPVLVPIFACTAKLSQLLTQLTWVLPDSGLIGLAQIHGEGRVERVREVAAGILRLLLTLAGAVTVVVLAINPQFVDGWVGRELFGGHVLNLLLAAGALGTSLVHGLSVIEAVLGQRLKVGLAGLVGGAVQVTLAIICGRLWGLAGVGLAVLLATITVTLPVGVYLLRSTLGLSPGWLLREVVAPWGRKAWVPISVALLLGFWRPADGIRLTVVPAGLLAMGYVWWTRPLYQNLPLPSRVRRWLVAIRLAPDKA